MNKGKKILLAVILVVLSLALYGLYEYNRKPAGTAASKADAVLTAKELIDSFSSQQESATKYYHDKVIEVSGTLASVDSTGTIPVLAFGAEGSSTSISCQMDSTETGPFPAVGSFAKVKGRFVGFSDNGFIGSDIMLSQCLMISTK